MPTIEINPGDRVKFLDSQGALASEFSYDENGGAIILQDDQGNPADQKVGALEADKGSISELQQINFENKSEISGSRSFGTTYQNTNDYTILVAVDTQLSAGTDQNFRLSLLVSESSSPAVGDDFSELRLNGIDFGVEHTSWVLVPPAYYYEARSGDNTLDRWFEGGMR